MKPNLFHYAPSELSQDAILCWLLSWADKKHEVEDPVLHELGRKFLDSIYECTQTIAPATYQSIELRPKDGGIDILCIVNGDTALIIENKVGTKQHSDQLPRYKEHVIKKGFPSEKILSLYLQTGEQSDYAEVVKHGYFVYERKDLLKVLESSDGKAACEKSDIIGSYSSYIRQIEDEVKSFKTTEPRNWSCAAWKGFYTKLQKVIPDGRWDYVPNPSGGFLGFWWHFQGDDQCEQYLQLEQEKFCFKIWVNDREKRSSLRETWHQRIIDQCSSHGLKVKRPNRFGNGKYMTVAILEQEYRIVDDQNHIDLQKTLEFLRKVESVLDDMNAQQALGADLASSAAQA